MIRAFYGLSSNPFEPEECSLLKQQQEIYDTLRVHCQQGGLCLLLGVPGTGKSMVKETLRRLADKRTLVVTVARTLHTYVSTIKILCQAFKVDFDGLPFTCEKRLIEEVYSLNQQGRVVVTVIDDAHLLDMYTLRKLRLLFEDFPKNHNVILVGQPTLLSTLSLSVNEDIKSRVTYSVMMRRLNPDAMQAFILDQLDRVKLGHNVFTEDAIDLIVRSADGVLRKVKNLCLSCLVEGVRAQTKTVGLEIVNRVLIQPHWRKETDRLLEQ